MRTQDRGSTAAKKPVVAGPLAGERLPTPSRERKPALAALAALLVLVGALGTTMLVMRAGDRIEAIKIIERVPAGQPVPESAMAPVLVAEDSAVNYVRWNQRELLQDELRPDVDLVDGTVLVGEMLTGEETLGQNEVIVGLSLQPGQYPSGLAAGDIVAAYWVGRDAGAGDEGSAGPDTVIADQAKVEALYGETGEIGTSSLPVTLRIPSAQAPQLARAASNGEVSLVIVGSGDAANQDETTDPDPEDTPDGGDGDAAGTDDSPDSGADHPGNDTENPGNDD